jgi:hypothetical protein
MTTTFGKNVMPRITKSRSPLNLPLLVLAVPALAVAAQTASGVASVEGPASAQSRPANTLVAQAAPAEPKGAETKGASKAVDTKAGEAKGATSAKSTDAKAAGAGASAPAKAEPGPLAQFAWLDGCWRGSVNQREYREHWLPLRGNLMLGVSHTVRGERTQDFEYLRIEHRPEGTFYVDQPSGKKDKENAYKFVGRTLDTADGRNDEIFTFENTEVEFPQRIIYRRGTEGWLYATVEGKVRHKNETKLEDHKVIYPMRRIDCQSGEFIRK